MVGAATALELRGASVAGQRSGAVPANSEQRMPTSKCLRGECNSAHMPVYHVVNVSKIPYEALCYIMVGPPAFDIFYLRQDVVTG